MSWTAFFQADGELRHTIAVAKFEHTVQHKLDEFVNRMSHPEVGLWWVWTEETGDDDGEENNEAKALEDTSDVDAGHTSSLESVVKVLKGMPQLGPF